MIISGLQKLSLLDYPNKMACIVFLGGCNFRCPFCHNAPLVVAKEFENIEQGVFFEYLEKRKNLLEAVVVSGGEPLANEDIFEFLQKIKSMGFLVKVDTNGSFPKKLKQIVEKKLVDYVAMDIKNSFSKYAKTCGKEDIKIDSVKESIQFLLENNVDYEFRTTVVNKLHEKEDFLEIAKMICGAKRYFLQDFKNSENVIEKGFSSVGKDALTEFAKIFEGKVEKVEIR